MKKIENIQDIYDAEVNLVIKQSSILLQKQSDGFNGELKTSGLLVENYIKDIIKKHIPIGYRICSGYIATTDTITDTNNLAQHDIIIIDDRVPSIYKFGVGDIEIVPAEAVCGIIEIKRTLTKVSINNAIEHLLKTKRILETYRDGIKSKMASNNLAGPTMGVATSSPLYAIIGLATDQTEVDSSYINDSIVPHIHEFIDMVWSLSDGFLLRLCVTNDVKIYYPLTVTRKMNAGYKPVESLSFGESQDNGVEFRIGISMLRTWITNTSSSGISPEINAKYFGV